MPSPVVVIVALAIALFVLILVPIVVVASLRLRAAADGGPCAARGREEATAATPRSTTAARRARCCGDDVNGRSLSSLRFCSHCCVFALLSRHRQHGPKPKWAVSSADLIFGLWASAVGGICSGKTSEWGKIMTLYYIWIAFPGDAHK